MKGEMKGWEVLVEDGRIIGGGRNRRVQYGDQLMAAEINRLRKCPIGP